MLETILDVINAMRTKQAVYFIDSFGDSSFGYVRCISSEDGSGHSWNIEMSRFADNLPFRRKIYWHDLNSVKPGRI